MHANFRIMKGLSSKKMRPTLRSKLAAPMAGRGILPVLWSVSRKAPLIVSDELPLLKADRKQALLVRPCIIAS